MGRHKCLTKAQTEIYNLGIALLKAKDILDDKGPPPDKIYEVLIEKSGYNDGVILHQKSESFFIPADKSILKWIGKVLRTKRRFILWLP